MNNIKQTSSKDKKVDPEYWAIFEKTKAEYGLPTAKQNFNRMIVLVGLCLLAGLVYMHFADFGKLPWNVTDREVGSVRLGLGFMAGSVLAIAVTLLYLIWLWILSRKVLKVTEARMLEIALARIKSKK